MLNSSCIWIDIENPPQVQYLTPFVGAFADRGYPVMVTARDTGITFELLAGRGIDFARCGSEPPGKGWRKPAAVLARAAHLLHLTRRSRPRAVICSSRAAAIVAAVRGIPCFVFCDYEFAELDVYRHLGARLLHPDVLPADVFLAKGFSRERLIGFDGLKEDISFAGSDIDGVEPFDLGPTGDDELMRVLVRPAAESSHYFDPGSRSLSLALLDHLAPRRDVLTVFAPRHPSQIRYISSRSWQRDPVVLDRGIPFVQLLKAVDRVVSAGGTMLREAAYLGLPAFSLLAGEIGAVDQYLVRTGHLRLLRSAEQVGRTTASDLRPVAPLPRNTAVVDELTERLLLDTEARG